MTATHDVLVTMEINEIRLDNINKFDFESSERNKRKLNSVEYLFNDFNKIKISDINIQNYNNS